MGARRLFSVYCIPCGDGGARQVRSRRTGLLRRGRRGGLGKAGLRWLMAASLASALSAGPAGCVKGPLDKPSQKLFFAGYRSFQSGDYRDADRSFGEVIARNPTSWALSEVHYLRGLSRLKLGRRAEAKDDFRKGATASPGRELTQLYSAVALANLEYEEGNDATAAHLYRQAIEHRDKNLPMDAMLYRLAVSLQRLGRWAEADDVLARLLSEHRDSSLIDHARSRFRARGFTVQTGAFADRTNAESLASRLRQEGFEVRLPPPNGDRMLHAVCVGRYQTYREAAQEAARLRDRGYSALVKP